MNPITESRAAADVAAASPQPLRRIYAGQGQPQDTAADYTVLIPTEDVWPRETIVRAVVADALQRNGKVVDEDTLEATVASVAAADGPLAAGALAWKLHVGESRSHGPLAPPFHGYAVAMPAALQRSLVAYAGEWSAQRDAAPPASMGAEIAELRALANGNGATDVLQTLGALEAAIQAGQAASAQGQRVDAVAVRALVEFATRMGKEREAAKILERYTALKGVEGDVRTVGQDIGRVFNGRDPLTGRALNTDQRVEAAFGLIGNGFKLVGDLGAAAQLLGVGGRLASTLIGIAPAGIAIVGFAAGMYGLIRKVRETINEPQWDEFRARFPLAEEMEPRQFLKAAMRQIAGMPIDPDNGLSTASRVLEIVGQNPETRERFLAFLRQKGQSAEMLEALSAGKFDGVDKEQAAGLGRASKGFAREFFELEIDDTKRYVRDRDGQRTRGTYLLGGEAKADAERSTNKLGGAVDEALRAGAVLVGGTRDFHAMLGDMLGKLRSVEAHGTSLTEQQRTNLGAAAVAASATAGLSRVDHLIYSKDGSRLFAVQGDPQSETRRMATIDVATATRQDVAASSHQLTQSAGVLQMDREPPQVLLR